MAVDGSVEVEVEGRGGQFGQTAVVSQHPERVVGHVTESNTAH